MSAIDNAPSGVSGIPVARMVEEIVGCKWSLRLLALSAAGVTRPAEMQRACPGLSAKVMNERLKKMVRFGILERSAYGEKPPLAVHYRLTAFGERFQGLLREICRLQEALDGGAFAPGKAREEG